MQFDDFVFDFSINTFPTLKNYNNKDNLGKTTRFDRNKYVKILII
jgi:hypothetical protein